MSGKRIDRYSVASTPAGSELQCDETPGIAVRIDAGFAFSESDARKLGPRVILLDGAGRFAPLIDGDAKLYNLDHHQGCVRAFTLATCEQALVLVAKGLDLDRGGWTLYANEPDLDVALAIWVLLNHRRVMQLSDAEQRVILPLIRLEGAIDAGGTESSAYCGLPEPTLSEARSRLDHLFQRDQALRALPSLDASARTAALLREIDALVFVETEFASSRPLEEVYGNTDLDDDRVAVACRDSSGIYDVEQRLRERWGARLGLIVLQREPGKYTLRATGALHGVSLEPLFSYLNTVDPAVDGRPASQCWGGSNEIGGSPRDRRSELTPDGVLRASRWVQRRPLRRSRAVFRALWTSAALALAVIGVGSALQTIPGYAPTRALEDTFRLTLLGVGALAAAAVLVRRQARESLWIPGFRAPAGRLWLLLTPLSFVLCAIGGALAPAALTRDPVSLSSAIAAAVLAAFGVEVWFRSWVYGLLRLAGPPRAGEQLPLFSVATLVSGALYAVAALGVGEPALELLALGPLQGLAPLAQRAAAALLAGITLGVLRERSLSLWPGIAVQITASLLFLLLAG